MAKPGAAHMSGMTTINATALAQQKAARETDGKFGNQLHAPSPVVLGAPIAGSEEIGSLHAFARAQPGTIEGRGLANQARLAAAARVIHGGLPEAATFTLDKAEGKGGDGYIVARAWDASGYQLGEDAREHIVKNLREAGVVFIHAPVSLADARIWTPESVSPTSPKITSKGRTVYVTLPDGSVVDRTSKTRQYSHAIVAHPEEPELVKASAAARIREHEVNLARLDEALAADKLKVRTLGLSGRGDPDVDYKGEPSYVGFQYTAYSVDGKQALAEVRGNSKQEVRGTYDEEGNYDVHRMGKVFGALRTSLQEKRSRIQGYKDGEAATIKAVDEGSYDFGGYAVSGFSASVGNAEKTARANEGSMPTRRFSVQAIDE